MTRRVPEWVESSTSPTGHEVAAVVSPVSPEVMEAACSATEPLDAEVTRLLRSRAQLQLAPQRSSWAPAWAPALVAAGALAAVGLWSAQSDPYGVVGSELGAVAEWHGQTFELGPSIDVTAEGSLRVAQADTSGTVVDLLSGHASFSVDPGGEYRHLLVEARGVEVEVKGTVFDVAIQPSGDVWVECTRGKVAVRYAGVERFVTAGHRWSSAELEVELVQAPVADATPRTSEPPVSVPIAERETQAPPVASVPAPPVTPAPPVVVEALAEPTASAARDFVRAQRHMARMHPPAELLAEWDAFLANWPDAAEVPEAKMHRLQALAAVAPNRDTLSQIDQYLASAPRHELLIEAHELRAALGEGALDDCALVSDSFAWLASYGDSTQAANASASLGLCASTPPAIAANALNRALALGVNDRERRAQVVQALAVLESDDRRRREK